MLTLKNIKKAFGDNEVLKGISLSVKSGEVYGLIGANGAGKTTLMNIIAQMMLPNEGEVYIDNKRLHSINDLSGNIGYMLDIPAMYDFLTAYEYFELLASPMGLSKAEVHAIADKLLSEVSLKNVENKRIKSYSRGMKQRMGIAAALISNPKVVLMDEPSSALDPLGRYEVLQIIQKLKAQGKTVILSTHILNDIEKVCDQVGLLVGGNIVVEGKLSEVLAKFKEDAFLLETATEDDMESILKQVTAHKSYLSHTKKGNTCEIAFKPGEKEAMFACITQKASGIQSLMVKSSSIETIFLSLSQGDKK